MADKAKTEDKTKNESAKGSDDASTSTANPDRTTDEVTENTDEQGNLIPAERRITEADLPSRGDVPLLSAEGKNPNEDWTSQSPGRFVDPGSLPGQYVKSYELPTKEGLRDIGVTDPEQYLASVHVRK